MKNNIPLIGHPYTAAEIQHLGWSPCAHRLHHRCIDQCVWAYWHSGDRRYTKYRWKETYLAVEPVYSDTTWIKLDF